MRKITIITRSYPPSKGINGVLANEMAAHLIPKGAEVNIICIQEAAEGNKEQVEPVGIIHPIKPINNKNNKVKKTISLIFEGYRMLKKAKTIQSDLIICTTSPPLLPFWASILLKNKNWALWSFDLFPEGFPASKMMKADSLLYKFLFHTTYKNAPKSLIALGQKQAEFIQQNYRKKIPTVLLPAGVLLDKETKKTDEIPSWKQTNDKILLGYFGNVGVPHNPVFLKKLIDAVENSSRFYFILSVYGIFADEVKEYAKGKENIIVHDGGLPEEHLAYIDVHVVSLITEWTHIAVPSKALTAISVGRPILFCGSEESDNWQMFKNCGWLIDEKNNMDAQIKDFLSSLNKETILTKSTKTSSHYAELQAMVLKSFDDIMTL